MPRPPSDISLLPRGAAAHGRRAFRLQRRAPAASGRAANRRLLAAHADPGRSACGVAGAGGGAGGVAAWFADQAAVGGPPAPAGCAESRVAPRFPPLPVPGASGAAAALRIAAGVRETFGPRLFAAGPLGSSALLAAAAAHLEAGLGRKPAAASTTTTGGARGVALTVAKVPRLLLHRIPERHDRPPRSARVAGGQQACRLDPPHLHP